MVGDVLVDFFDNKFKKVEELFQIVIDNLFELFFINIFCYVCVNENWQII